MKDFLIKTQSKREFVLSYSVKKKKKLLWFKTIRNEKALDKNLEFDFWTIFCKGKNLIER